MESRLYRATLFALYQLTVLVGIAMLPVALVARQVGIAVPIHRAIDRLEAAYEQTAEQA
ncbi:hypothetical protein [Halapricum hydrolyticum]|uniref:Uncharacterized protein n=1 Tax=Halapricum hydrolyticum TaxID=2979991 RepID=A0AAE3IFG2_9EURY|nr:hypothetical protein [Halapricum hydrolyticum]MCU4719219.1 hypothetical protein [Halapricum hydrolyticum]MCU4728348.1 hypothetical protein [Halapricum hydrolyticum]